MLLFNATDRNMAYIKANLGRMILGQETEKIFETVKREMISNLLSGVLRSDSPDDLESQSMVVDVTEYEIAARQTMADFVQWATDEANLRREVDLDWDEVVGFPAPASFRASLGYVLRRLDESWKAVQVLSRIVSGTCGFTPGGASFEGLMRNLASGEDVRNFLKGDAAHESRFPSWTELRSQGLLGVTSAGLAEDAARLRERLGPLDRWPLQTEVWLATYEEGAILLASLDAAMEVVREAARHTGVVVASDNDVQGHELEAVQQTYGRAVATVSKSELETALREHEIAVEMGASEINVRKIGRTEQQNLPATGALPDRKHVFDEYSAQPRELKDTVGAVGVPIAWVHADNEISAFDVAVRSVSMILHEDLKPEEASELEMQGEREHKENILRRVRSRIGDVISGRTCHPGMDEFDDGTKQLKSIIVH